MEAILICFCIPTFCHNRYTKSGYFLLSIFMQRQNGGCITRFAVVFKKLLLVVLAAHVCFCAASFLSYARCTLLIVNCFRSKKIFFVESSGIRRNTNTMILSHMKNKLRNIKKCCSILLRVLRNICFRLNKIR